MARYRGPKSKIARRFKDPIFGPDKALDRKPYTPGQHGPNKRRAKQSEYAVQLAEKQKAKYTYGLLERQFSNLFKKAARKKGITGENLLKFLESRLDNTVFRLGLSPSRAGARQLVGHRHITVNGEVVNIPSYTLRAGDVVAVREKSKTLVAITDSLSRSRKNFPWLEWDNSTLSGR
ncbi:MAG: 30S ribosomal protein S4, partial [Bacteroidetes bacterium]|nr:30S ribosomal protein S4 [Bacteroidota bacterium]